MQPNKGVLQVYVLRSSALKRALLVRHSACVAHKKLMALHSAILGFLITLT